MGKTLFAVVAGLSIVTVGAPANAANPQHDAFILSAERFLGIYRTTRDPDQGDSRSDMAMPLTFAPLALSPYTAPRLGLDYVLDSGLSLGGALGVANYDVDDDDDGHSWTMILLAPRVGYVFPIGARSGFWLRGGITYYDIEDDSDGFALTAEGLFLLSVADSFGLLLGPVVDFGLDGEDHGRDVRFHTIGFAFGLAGLL